MTPFQDAITAPAAWTSQSIGGKAGLTRLLTAAELAAFDTILARTWHLTPQAVSRNEFAHPDIDSLTAWLAETIRHGRGAVLLSGLTRDRYSEDALERIYWGIGTHLGEAVTQSMLGDRLGHVQHVKDDPVARGYRSNGELTPHTDSYRIVGLMCLQRAETGGFSRIVSGLALHNAVLTTRPDLLAPLYEGYYYAIAEARFSAHPVTDFKIPVFIVSGLALHNAVLTTRPDLLAPLYEGYYYAIAEARFSAHPVTDFKIPVFCCVDDMVSICYSRSFIEHAARLRNEPLPPRLLEALDYLDALAEDDDIRVKFMLEPGEILLWHNFQMLHARDSYQDSPEHTRHLLRLWLRIENDRPMVDAMLQRARIYERIYNERSGRVPASAMAGA